MARPGSTGVALQPFGAETAMTDEQLDFRRRRIAYRAWHRGTREADMMVGGFADRYSADWGPAELDWFEAFLAEQDVDIMAWGLGRQPAPERYHGPLMDAFRRLDFIGPSR
jgi:antitoxin CptB